MIVISEHPSDRRVTKLDPNTPFLGTLATFKVHSFVADLITK